MEWTIVVPQKPISRARRDKFLMKAACSASAKRRFPFTAEMLKMQPDNSRIVQISRKVLACGLSLSAHVKDFTSNARRETIDPGRIPRSVASRCPSECYSPRLGTIENEHVARCDDHTNKQLLFGRHGRLCMSVASNL